MRKLVLATVVAACGLLPGVVSAQTGPNLIETRQTLMSLQSGNYAGIRAVVAAKGDLKTLEGPAKGLVRSAAVLPSLFPQGTATGNNTRALPEIWSDNAGFQKAAATLGEAAGALAKAAAAGDAAGVDAAVKAIGDVCGSCHRAYRAR